MKSDGETSNMKLQNAPIIMFVYNRFSKTKQVMDALLANEESEDTDIFIYSDAPKNETAVPEVLKVREYIESVDGFRNITIVERKDNYGLARNITEGVTEVINKYGSTIVLEDDIVVGRYFLRYMNEALRRYEDDNRVMEVSGYVEPAGCDDLPQSMFIKNYYCWGWATWKDRWALFSREKLQAYKSMSFVDRYHFNLEGATNNADQLFYNAIGILDTWAVYWDYTMFKNNGLVLVPNRSLVNNVGGDGSGEHQKNTLLDDVDTNLMVNEFPREIKENAELRKRIKKWYKINRNNIVKRLYYIARKQVLYLKNIEIFK